MKLIRIAICLLPLALLAQTDETQKLRDQIAAQQKQLEALRQALDTAQKTLDSQQLQLDHLVASRTPTTPASAATPSKPLFNPEPAASSVVVAEKEQTSSPLAFRIGGADFIPGGFMDYSTVWRSTDIGSGVATSFAGVPLANTPAGRMQEFRSSAANSRVTLTINEKATEKVSLTGYLEGDFTGNQPTNLYVTSNSNTWRMRHFYVGVERGKWEVLGGQTWTLLTPNRVGVSPDSRNVFVTLGEDSNYMAGLVWSRPGQLRVTYHPNSHWSLAAAVENPQQYVTTAVTLPAFAATQVDNGTVPATANVRPDIVAKIAYDTKVSGKALHFELAGFSRQFRDSPAQGKYFDAQGLGGSVDAVVEVAKHFTLIATGFYSSGGGREDNGLGPDLIVGPDGSISPVHSMAGIAGFEYAPTTKTQFFGYYGGTYFDRNYTAVSPGNYLGFGYPGSSSSANRQFQEPIFGYYYTYWKNPKYGALQLITEYAFLSRAPWYVAPGTPSTAHAHMVFGSMRFTLP